MSREKNTRIHLLDFHSLKLLCVWWKDGPKPGLQPQTLANASSPTADYTWSLDPNVELLSVRMAISKAWQVSPWPESVKTRQWGHKGWSHWVWRAFVGGFFIHGAAFGGEVLTAWE